MERFRFEPGPEEGEVEALMAKLPERCRDCKYMRDLFTGLTFVAITNFDPDTLIEDVAKSKCSGYLGSDDAELHLPSGLVAFNDVGGVFEYVKRLRLSEEKCPYIYFSET